MDLFEDYYTRILEITNVWSPCGAVTNVLVCDILVDEFELQSRCYFHFRTWEGYHILPKSESESKTNKAKTI